eukprot:m51a1_g11195 hypothetical protein (82) ;mRNA; r:2989-3347
MQYPQLADPSGLDRKRISPGTFNEVKSWVEEFPHETRLVINPGKVTPNVMASARRDKVSQKEARSGKYVTYVPFVQATARS